jgi:hypothetical protein
MLMLEAAAGCGCKTAEEQLGFLGDMLESGLYFPFKLLAGDLAAELCPCCAYLDPDAAILDAVAGALTLRARYGVARQLN